MLKLLRAGAIKSCDYLASWYASEASNYLITRPNQMALDSEVAFPLTP